MTPIHAASPDDQTDHDRTSDGQSRYGAYLRQYAYIFYEEPADTAPTTDPVHFALAAWTTAVPPVMTPGYVRWHPCIDAADPRWENDRRVVIAVQLALPVPAVFNRLLSTWRDWSCDHNSQRWYDPATNDGITILTTAHIRIPVTSEHLPTPRYQHRRPHIFTAKRAIAAICHLLNTTLDDALTALAAPESAT